MDGTSLLAAALAAPGVATEVTEENEHSAVVRVGVELWRLEPSTTVDTADPPTYRVFTARPASTTAPRVRGVAQLPDGRSFPLDDARGVGAFAATGAADAAGIAVLAARFADAADFPRRVLDTPRVRPDGDGTVVVLHTARRHHPDDEDEAPSDVTERWTVAVSARGVVWRHVETDRPGPRRSGEP
jgi:hypothetical protein